MAGKQAEAAEAPLRIKVNPIDRTKKGSRGERRRIIDLMRRSARYAEQVAAAVAAEKAAAAEGKPKPESAVDPLEGLAIYDEREAILGGHLETLDGADLQDALDELSEKDVDDLFAAILGGAAEESVPTPSGEPSNDSPKDSQ